MSAFTPAGSGGSVQNIELTGSKIRTTVNLDIILANTEYPVVLPVGTTQYFLKTREDCVLKIREVSGGDYTTIPTGNHFSEDGLKLDSVLTLYLESTTPAQILELIYWT